MTGTELDQRKKRWRNGVKVGLAIVAGLIVSPVIFVAIKGLAGLAIAGAAGLAIVNAAPVVGDKMANWKLKALKAEAAKNPIETLQHDYAKRQQALGEFKEAINTFSASVQNFESKLEGFKAQFPKDVPKFEGQLLTMKKLLGVRRERYQQARESMVQYEGEIQRADAIWKMGLEAAKMNAAAGMSEEDFFQKIKVETALDSVTTSMNMAFAELETSLADEEADKKAMHLLEPAKPVVVIDALPIESKVKV